MLHRLQHSQSSSESLNMLIPKLILWIFYRFCDRCQSRLMEIACCLDSKACTLDYISKEARIVQVRTLDMQVITIAYPYLPTQAPSSPVLLRGCPLP